MSKKFFSFMFALLISLGTVFAPASQVMAATSRIASVKGSTRFISKWERTITYIDSGHTIGTLTYGYDTWWIAEDYAWSCGYNCDTKAAILRDGYDNEYNESDYKSKGKYSKLEIPHKTYYVNYRITFKSNYYSIAMVSGTSHFKE